jgi:L-ascorbate metabolism protein UlaG (beta-lactamase superfamily)
MIVPKLSDDKLLSDIDAARHLQDSFHLWWLGQSGFLVQWRNQHLLFDPYLSDSLTDKYAKTDKPHARISERVIDPSSLDFVDVVTSSHNHTDHLDGPTLKALLDANPNLEIVVPAANRDFAADRLGTEARRLTEIDVGSSVTSGHFTFHGVPAAHESVDRDAAGRYKYLGFVVEFGGATIYHSGDTVQYSGMEQGLSKWNIDLAILPINGRAAERRVAGNLWGREAAQLAHDIGAQMVIPCHYDMFAFNTATPDEFVDAAQRLGQNYTVLELGERWTGT